MQLHDVRFFCGWGLTPHPTVGQGGFVPHNTPATHSHMSSRGRAYGHVKISRKFFESRWRSKKHWDDADAMLDLIQRAAWGDRQIEVAGTVVRWQRGQVLLSVTVLQRDWRWSRGRVQRFLQDLERDGFMYALSTYHKVGTVYEIPNWTVYQDNAVVSESEIGTQNGTQNGTHKPSSDADLEGQVVRRDERKNEPLRIKRKKEKDNVALPLPGRGRMEYPDEFEAVWQAYPQREGGNAKKSAYKAYRATRVAGATADELLRATQGYARQVERAGTHPRYVKMTATFFGPDEPWREYLTPLAPANSRATVAQSRSGYDLDELALQRALAAVGQV